MSYKWTLLSAAMVLGLVTAPSNAAVVYSLTGSAPFYDTDTGEELGRNDFGFTLTLSDFLSSNITDQPLDSCYYDTFTCTTASFQPSPNSFSAPGLNDYIGFNYLDSGGGGGTGFLFFLPGALGALGVYFSEGGASGTPNYGSFGEATLTVTGGPNGVVPIPAALPLLASGLGALGFIGWRRKRKEKLAAA